MRSITTLRGQAIKPSGAREVYRCEISKCFRPNSRASMDNAPGPIIANVAPDVAKRMGIPREAHEKATHTSTTAINVPLIGVHKPTSRKIAAPNPIDCGITTASCGVSIGRVKTAQKRNVAVITRCRRRPLPGQPFGNVEKRRCKDTPFSAWSLGYLQLSRKRPNEGRELPLSEDL